MLLSTLSATQSVRWVAGVMRASGISGLTRLPAAPVAPRPWRLTAPLVDVAQLPGAQTRTAPSVRIGSRPIPPNDRPGRNSGACPVPHPRPRIHAGSGDGANPPVPSRSPSATPLIKAAPRLYICSRWRFDSGFRKDGWLFWFFLVILIFCLQS